MTGRWKYEGSRTREISFPLGGIGTGCIGLGGNGRLMDWEIFNRPNKGSINGASHFAVKAEQAGKLLDARVLQGDQVKDLVGQYQKKTFVGYGYGPERGTMAGFPHFENCVFEGEFPLAQLTFEDSHFPGRLQMRAFNPLIPLDEDASSMPAAFFEIEAENTQQSAIDYTIALTVVNPFDKGAVNRPCQMEKGSGMLLEQTEKTPDQIGWGQLFFAADCEDAVIQPCWMRGRWFDGPTVYWQEFCAAAPLKKRLYDQPGSNDPATLSVKLSLAPGEKRSVRFVIAWYFPNQHNDWKPGQADKIWKNYYATQFESAQQVAQHCLKQWDDLYARTMTFHDAMFSSTLPDVVIEAASANLSVLKSPTVLRLEDGSFYGWEGVHEQSGSCEGSCTHVWNYAYAAAFLFPGLERSMRELDFRENQWENGRMSFRLQLPLGSGPNDHIPCLDGQMGAVIKTYRDWKLCGDDEWLKKLWPSVKKALEYAWHPENKWHWDTDKDGVLEGRQHHTLDMELFGPSSWLQSFYLAALKAAAEMAEYLGEPEKAREYLEVFESGRAFCEKQLFNGEYFIQQVDVTDESLLDPYPDAHDSYWNEEAGQLKYQVAQGCEIDQVVGQWHANLCGLGEILDRGQVRQALRSIYRYNYKPVMRDFFNPCRVYCLNGESGTVMCDYPQGKEVPVVPVPYCQECMTGFEYQAASHMIGEGMIDEGLELVSAIRARYDGEKRNPWNEIECGSNYARPMASFALLGIFSGFEFSVPQRYMGFTPIEKGDYRCMWSLQSGWGEFVQQSARSTVAVKAGSVKLKQVKLGNMAQVSALYCDGTAIPFTRTGDTLCFDEVTVTDSLVIEA